MSLYKEILAEMQELHDRKANDYTSGDEFGNFVEAERIGIPDWKGAFIRLQDKYTRLCNAVGGKELMVNDETIEDTLIDMANYSVLILAMYKRKKRRANE